MPDLTCACCACCDFAAYCVVVLLPCDAILDTPVNYILTTVGLAVALAVSVAVSAFFSRVLPSSCGVDF